MLKELFISRVRIKMLEYFVFNPDEELHVRGLVNLLEEEINAVRRELQNLESINLVIPQRKGNKLFYRLDKTHPFVPDLKSLLVKDRDDVKIILKALKKIDGLNTVILMENYLTQKYENEYDIDLFFAGEVDIQKIVSEMKKLEEKIDRSLRLSVLKPKDLEFQLKKRDGFLLNLLKTDKIFLLGSVKDLA